MKSKLFKDTQGLDMPFDLCAPDKVSICLRLGRRAYDFAVAEAKRRNITIGEYIGELLAAAARGGERPLM